MRPNETRRYTIKGKHGVHSCPNIAATDSRLKILAAALRAASPYAAARIRHDFDLLLDWRLELMRERGSTT